MKSNIMRWTEILELEDSFKAELKELWNREYPEKLAYSNIKEFNQYLNGLSDQTHFILQDENEVIVGWYIDFIREEKRWFAIIIDLKYQRKGLGKKMLEIAKQKESELYAWVIDHNNDRKQDGSIYQSTLNFYIKNGFKQTVEERLELDKISAVKIKWEK